MANLLIPDAYVTDDYRRALAAEPELRTLEHVVLSLAGSCAGCAWSDVLKPLTRPYVGWSRGVPLESAPDGDESGTVTLADLDAVPRYTGASLLALEDTRTPAGADAEQWLRTSEAFDAVTDVWLAYLEDTDPAEGHGLRYQRGPAGGGRG